jgi:hypothetical protein
MLVWGVVRGGVKRYSGELLREKAGPTRGGMGQPTGLKSGDSPAPPPPSATRADLAVPTRARAALVGVEDEADLG